jgi:hypothetical protein
MRALHSALITIGCVLVYVMIVINPGDLAPLWLRVVLILPIGFAGGYYGRDTAHELAVLYRARTHPDN